MKYFFIERLNRSTYIFIAKKVKVDHSSDDSTDVDTYVDNRVYDSDEDSDTEITNELTNDKKRVLEFMQTATLNELQLMQSCSKKKIDAIIASRPFENWIDLVKYSKYLYIYSIIFV